MLLRFYALVQYSAITHSSILNTGHGAKNLRKRFTKLGKKHKEIKGIVNNSVKAWKDCLYNCEASEAEYHKMAEQKQAHYCGDHTLCNAKLKCKSKYIQDPEAQAAYKVLVDIISLI